MPYRQSHPDPAMREIIFQMTKADGTPDTGLAFVAGNLQLRKGRAFGAAANSSLWVNVDATQLAAVVEIGIGTYIYTFTAAEIDTPGAMAFKAQKGTGLLFTTSDEVQRAYLATVVAGTLTTAAFSCSRTEVNANHFKNSLVLIHTGPLAGELVKCSAFTPGSPALVTLDATFGILTAAPIAGAVIEFVNR